MKAPALLTFLLAIGLPGAAAEPPRPPGPGTAKAPASLYDSQARGNDFSGDRALADIGFHDVKGGVASFSGSGHLVLTPDDINDGRDALKRDYVLRDGGGGQARDLGCRVVLPPNYRVGGATVGICLRFRPGGNGLVLDFAPDGLPLSVYSLVDGVSTRRGAASLTNPYVPENPVAVEARVVADAAVTLTATDLTTGQILGFLHVPLNFGEIPAGSFGLVPWMTKEGGHGSIEVASVETYPVTAVACDGDSLTYGENSSRGKGTASPLATTYPGVLQKLLGNRYHVFNLGRSGLTVSQMNADAAARVDALLARAERPPVIVLEGGTNDFGIDHSVAPPMPVAQAAATVYQRLQTYWGARHAARADATVIDVTNAPAGHPVYERNLGGPTAFNARRDALNRLRKIPPSGTGARPDRSVDLTGDSRIGQDGSERNVVYFNAQDRTHLTDAGYAIKAEAVAAAIRPPDKGR